MIDLDTSTAQAHIGNSDTHGYATELAERMRVRLAAQTVRHSAMIDEINYDLNRFLPEAK